MSAIRCIYYGAAPEFPASDQHPDAVRYGPITRAGGERVFVDAIGGEPTLEEIDAVLTPPAPAEATLAERLAAPDLTIKDLKVLLGLPT